MHQVLGLHRRHHPHPSRRRHHPRLHGLPSQRPSHQTQRLHSRQARAHQRHYHPWPRRQHVPHRRRLRQEPQLRFFQVQKHHHHPLLQRHSHRRSSRAAGTGQGQKNHENERDYWDHSWFSHVESELANRYFFWDSAHEHLFQGSWEGEDAENYQKARGGEDELFGHSEYYEQIDSRTEV